MSGAKLTIHLDDVAAQAMLRGVEFGVQNARPLWTEIGSALEASTRARLETTKQGPDGVPWLDLTPAWAARKAERGHAAGILTMRGDLLNSVHFEAEPGAVEIIAGPTEYAAIHQYGGAEGMPPGAAAIPARPYMGLSADDQAEIQEATLDWLRRLTGG